jgi:hypothetical protein
MTHQWRNPFCVTIEKRASRKSNGANATPLRLFQWRGDGAGSGGAALRWPRCALSAA